MCDSINNRNNKQLALLLHLFTLWLPVVVECSVGCLMNNVLSSQYKIVCGSNVSLLILKRFTFKTGIGI